MRGCQTELLRLVNRDEYVVVISDTPAGLSPLVAIRYEIRCFGYIMN